jgi:hypothetical protein
MILVTLVQMVVEGFKKRARFRRELASKTIITSHTVATPIKAELMVAALTFVVLTAVVLTAVVSKDAVPFAVVNFFQVFASIEWSRRNECDFFIKKNRAESQT